MWSDSSVPQESCDFSKSSFVEDLRHDANKAFDVLAQAVQVTETSCGQKRSEDAVSNLEKEMMVEKQFAKMLMNVSFRTLNSGQWPTDQDGYGLFENFFKNIFEHLRLLFNDILKRLKERTKASNTIAEENKTLLVSLQKEQAESMYQKQRYDYLVAEKNTILATCKKQQEQLEERSKRILQLQRDGTVALWKKEKQKILDNMGSRETRLEEELRNAKAGNWEVKERLQKKIMELSTQVQLMKVEKECARAAKGSEEDIDKDQNEMQLKRKLYYKERALIIAESEIQKQQRYFAGFIQGILKDFRILMSRIKIDEFQYDRYQQKFHSTLESMLTAALEGTFTTFRIGLPSHYLGINLHMKEMPLRRRSNGLSSDKLFSSEEHHFDISDLSISSSLIKWREGRNGAEPDAEELLREATMTSAGNRFVNVSKGTLNTEEVKKQFPELQEEYLLQMFEEFKKFDTNHDWYLDAPELLRAVPEALGRMATTDEIKEAMQEVDTDNAGTIDFIKFVNVAQMIAKGEGKAPLFRKKTLKALQRKDVATSSVCTVQ